MSVTPMDLQVLFMQESRAAREADRMRRFPAEVRDRIGRRTVAESLRGSIDATEAAESKIIDGEGGGQSPNHFMRQGPRHQEQAEERQESGDYGKGVQIDLRA